MKIKPIEIERVLPLIKFAVEEENIRDNGNFKRALEGYITNHKENARNTIKEAMK